MLQNKIYQNFILEIFKTFFVILFGLSAIALTVRAVAFLELIVDNGYPVYTYFKFSLLNLFGIIPKFIPLSFLLSLTLFILRHIRDSELIILWTSGVKKIAVVNLFLVVSFIIFIFYLILTTLLTPLALNKSRQLLSQEQINSFLPTVRAQQFNDSFRGFTFVVGKKINNEFEDIFLNDKGNNLKNLSSNISSVNDTTIVAENGIFENKKLFLFNGQIISTKETETENEVFKFEQLSIDLGDLSTTTIKKPKLQETSTIKLLSCFSKEKSIMDICNEETKKEILPTLNRRIIMPLYIPVLSLICSLLLIKTKKNIFKEISIFLLGFSLLIGIEIIVRYTGLNNIMRIGFMFIPFILIILTYIFLIYKFSKETIAK